MKQMTIKEADRYAVIKDIKCKRINLKQGAKELCLSYSQMKRLWKNYSREGSQGLISKKRGKMMKKMFQKIILRNLGKY